MTQNSALSTNTENKPIIALDCDGVLLDFNTNFTRIYEKAFGKQLTIVSPNSYNVSVDYVYRNNFTRVNHFQAKDMYGVKFTDEEKNRFYEVWDEIGWKSMPMHDGALQACFLLHHAGYELVCVTTMATRFTDHRLENFRLHGFPIDRVIGLDHDKHNRNNNPKRKTIEDLHPVAFVDDLRRNFKDIQGVHTKLIYIDREYHDEPSRFDDIYYDVKYPSLLEFVKDFLKSESHGQDII